MPPHGHLLPFPPQTHFLSVAIEEFPSLLSEVNRSENPGHSRHPSLTLSVTSSPPSNFKMPHSLCRSSHLSPASTHFSAPPQPSPCLTAHSPVVSFCFHPWSVPGDPPSGLNLQGGEGPAVVLCGSVIQPKCTPRLLPAGT